MLAVGWTTAPDCVGEAARPRDSFALPELQIRLWRLDPRDGCAMVRPGVGPWEGDFEGLRRFRRLCVFSRRLQVKAAK